MQSLTLQFTQAEQVPSLPGAKRASPKLGGETSLNSPSAQGVSFQSMVEEEIARESRKPETEPQSRTEKTVREKKSAPKENSDSSYEVSFSEEKIPKEKITAQAFFFDNTENFTPQAQFAPVTEDSLSFENMERSSQAEIHFLTESDGEIFQNTEHFASIAQTEVQPSLTEGDIRYLKNNTHSSVFDELLDNVEAYVPNESDDSELLASQILSLEEPEVFLNEQKVLPVRSEKIADEKTTSDLTLTLQEDAVPEEKNELPLLQEESTAFVIRDERTVKNSDVTQKGEEKTEVPLKTELVRTGEHDVQMTMTLSENVNQNILSSSDQSAAATGSTFQEMLSQQIVQNAPDFVRAGNIVLRDGNQGTINMILKPEALGNVKVSLELSDKVITGEITVHSKEAMEAFKQNIESLKQAFIQSGYDDVQLSLNLSQNDSSSDFMRQGEQDGGERRFYANKAYGGYSVPVAQEDTALSMQDFVSLERSGINMIA